jgi:hypothetical protein
MKVKMRSYRDRRSIGKRFVRGYGRVVDLAGKSDRSPAFPTTKSNDSDVAAIESDWRKVWGDLSYAITRVVTHKDGK